MDIVYHWAPILVQDVDRSGWHAVGGRSDYISAFDYDSNWHALDNWDNVDYYDLNAVAYYSLVETGSHFFIIYAFYHPRDWCNNGLRDAWCQEHENDMEGVLLVVRKSASEFGVLEGIVTVYHDELPTYQRSDLTWWTHDAVSRVVVGQEAHGHGMKAFPHVGIRGADGLHYYPSRTTSEVPEGPNDRYVLYRLVDIFEEDGLWVVGAVRDRGSWVWNHWNTYEGWGKFAGDDTGGCGRLHLTCKDNAASPPWGWGGDGRIAMDPAPLYGSMFSDPGMLNDLDYVSNPYE